MMFQFALALTCLWVAGCGGGSSSGLSVDSVTACLKSAGASATATQQNPQPYGGDVVSARFPEGVAGVFVMNDAEAAKVLATAYAFKHTDESIYLSEDGTNAVTVPEGSPRALLSKAQGCV